MPILSTTPLLLVMGPTGVGKTQFAIELVKRFPLEIISVDSALVYRSMNIGTAKPTPAELAATPHHLIDIVDPSDGFSVELFCQYAKLSVNQILQSGRIPLLVGGTFLYFKAFLTGLAALPSANPAIRKQIESQAQNLGWPAMHQRLLQCDPDTAQRVHPNDQQRIQRALEVFQLTGQPLSKWLSRDGKVKLSVNSQSYKTLGFGLWPEQRTILHQRLSERLNEMMAKGFLEEVKALYQRGTLHLDLPAIRSVGYRQLWQHLEGDFPLDEAVYRALVATRQLAKRQLTWLRQWPNLTSLKSSDTLMDKSVLESVEKFVNKHLSQMNE